MSFLLDISATAATAAAFGTASIFLKPEESITLYCLSKSLSISLSSSEDDYKSSTMLSPNHTEVTSVWQ